MIAILTSAVMGFLILTVVYLLVSVYSRSVRRERLEKQFDAGDVPGDRDAYVEKGMEAYRHGLRRCRFRKFFGQVAWIGTVLKRDYELMPGLERQLVRDPAADIVSPAPAGMPPARCGRCPRRRR